MTRQNRRLEQVGARMVSALSVSQIKEDGITTEAASTAVVKAAIVQEEGTTGLLPVMVPTLLTATKEAMVALMESGHRARITEVTTRRRKDIHWVGMEVHLVKAIHTVDKSTTICKDLMEVHTVGIKGHMVEHMDLEAATVEHMALGAVTVERMDLAARGMETLTAEHSDRTILEARELVGVDFLEAKIAVTYHTQLGKPTYPFLNIKIYRKGT